MKPFLCIDQTYNKKNEAVNGDEFIVKRPSEKLNASLEESAADVSEIIDKSQLPLPLRIIKWVTGVVALIIFAGIIKAMTEEDISLKTAYGNAPALFWICGICAVIFTVLMLLSNKKEKETFETAEENNTFSDLDDICDDILADLGVPSDAKEIDILSFYYKDKDDNIKILEKGLLAPFNNLIFHVFKDSENLYLANLDGKYAIPLSSIKGIQTVKKTVRISSWNKDEDFKSEKYKPYKLNEDNYGAIFCKTYHILEFDRYNETWGIYFPSYELPQFEEISGIKA